MSKKANLKAKKNLNDTQVPVTAAKRLQKEYLHLKQDPIPLIYAEPNPSNIFKWYFVLKGSEKTPYEGGYYLGILDFPQTFPFKPPTFRMITPNGRFRTNTAICLSVSSHHPESWSPVWTIQALLNGLLSFMNQEDPTGSSIRTTAEARKKLAGESLEWNLRYPDFKKFFPQLTEEINNKLNIPLDIIVID